MQNGPSAFPAESLTGLAARRDLGLRTPGPGSPRGCRARLRLPPHRGDNEGVKPGLGAMTGGETLSETGASRHISHL